MIEQLETIPFTKMQGAGNDFVVLDNRELNISKQELIELAPTICDRKFGVGSDGIMALLPPEHEEADYTMFFRNPDGSDAGMCGNGARCMAQFAHSLGYDAEHHFNVHDQLYQAVVEAENIVRISFPMQASATEHSIDGETFYGIHTGTEHLVHAVSENLLEDEKALREQGQQLRYHDKFQPAGTNVNFISGIDNRSLKLQTYERGVEDLTLACGTGAIAAALICHHIQSPSQGSSPYKVETKGGQLTVYFDYQSTSSQYANIKLEGPAHFVFNGSYQL
jgi:diaminopimelate epimerase